MPVPPPSSGPLMSFLNGLHSQSKFLAIKNVIVENGVAARTMAVVIVMENRFTQVATRHYVVKGVEQYDSQTARHEHDANSGHVRSIEGGTRPKTSAIAGSHVFHGAILMSDHTRRDRPPLAKGEKFLKSEPTAASTSQPHSNLTAHSAHLPPKNLQSAIDTEDAASLLLID
jgi:hypothetical protein